MLKQDKPQCVGCGLSSAIIKHALCNGCIKTYREGASLLNSSSPLHLPIEKEPQIPRSILSIPGVAALLFEENTMGMGDGLSEGASAAIISAQHFQAKASDPRLTNKPSTARGADGGLNKFKNLGKANQVVAERKSKREEANLIGIGNGIKVSATLWSMEEGHGKMLQVSDVCLFRNPLSMDLFNVFLACGCPSDSGIQSGEKKPGSA
jgi:hypothetical protein